MILCNNQQKINLVFKTSTSRYVNADVNGSLNIMSKAVGDIIYSYIVDPIEACSMPSVITVKHKI